MKKKVIVIVGIFLICIPMLLGVEYSVQDEFPITETFSIENIDDNFDKQWSYPVFVKEKHSYRRRGRNVHIVAKPRLIGKNMINNEIKDNPEYFLEIYIKIEINFVTQANASDESIVFENTLRYEKCEGPDEGQLIWVDETEEMANQDVLIWTIKDDFFEVRVNPVEPSPTPISCTQDLESLCKPGSCLVYMDSVTLEVIIDYLPSQREIRNAKQYEDEAERFFQNGNYNKAKEKYQEAKEKYQEAKTICEDLGDVVTADDIQNKITWIDGQMKFSEGMKIFNDAEKIGDKEEVETIENAEEAIDKYQEAIDKYQEAINQFEKAKIDFTDANDDVKASECQNWITTCNDRISKRNDWINECNEKITELESESRRNKLLLYAGIGIVAAVGAGVAVTQIQKKKPETTIRKPPTIEKPTRSIERGPRLIIGDQTFDITTDSMTIGRGENADLQIEDPGKHISRIHAKIYRDERGQFWIRDNHSANGTYIYEDGTYKRIKKWLLYDGDTIALSYDSSRGARVTIQFRSQ